MLLQFTRHTNDSTGSYIIPTYQVSEVAGNGYVDVTVLATDESGIHLIGYEKPGDTSWSYSPTQHNTRRAAHILTL